VLGLVEASLPALPVAPWLRLGLANIAVVVALATGGAKTAGAVSIGRVAIVGLATGSLASPVFAMSLAGALASLGAMIAARRSFAGLSLVGWSIAGSAAHVLGQFAIAALLLGTTGVLMLAPPSLLAAVAFGALTGSLARIVVSRLT
jgi:heptaprenyl diphosphate synthase